MQAMGSEADGTPQKQVALPTTQWQDQIWHIQSRRNRCQSLHYSENLELPLKHTQIDAAYVVLPKLMPGGQEAGGKEAQAGTLLRPDWNCGSHCFVTFVALLARARAVNGCVYHAQYQQYRHQHTADVCVKAQSCQGGVAHSRSPCRPLPEHL